MKKDDDNSNQFEEYQLYCQTKNINGLYYELSATNSHQVNNLFNDVIKKILMNRKII